MHDERLSIYKQSIGVKTRDVTCVPFKASRCPSPVKPRPLGIYLQRTTGFLLTYIRYNRRTGRFWAARWLLLVPPATRCAGERRYCCTHATSVAVAARQRGELLRFRSPLHSQLLEKQEDGPQLVSFLVSCVQYRCLLTRTSMALILMR